VIHLLFIGDGPRDAAALPRIVEGVTGSEVRAVASPWARLHGRGYGKKLRFAVRQAQSDQLQGLVATVDADKDGRSRLRKLREERAGLRQQEPLYPVALGCADPHLEAWLLDDAVAVRQGLSLDRQANVPNVRRCPSPKTTLEELHSTSPRADDSPQDVWGDIARELNRARCAHTAETGLQAFAEDVVAEMAPLLA
jgi:hypothetical protein